MKRRRAKRAVPDRSASYVRFGRICIGCGCCDEIGCAAGCGWRAAHPSVPVGVCTECAAYLPLFKLMTVPVAQAIYCQLGAKIEEWG